MKITDILKTAMVLEEDGRAFYLKCAEKTENPKGKEMFLYLAGEEERHYKKLGGKYKEHAGRAAKITDSDRKNVAKKEHVHILKSVFDRKKIKIKSDILDALNKGSEAERKSIEVYGKFEKSSDDDALKKLFRWLIKEEENHLAILEMEYEFVTETGEWHDFGVVTS